MPRLDRTAGPSLHYALDDYTDTWKDAPYVILQHGHGRSGRFWYRWVSYLSRFYKVVRPDVRGLGESSGEFDVDNDSTLTAYVEDLAAIIDALGAQSVHFCGESMGGQIGSKAPARAAEAALPPERVSPDSAHAGGRLRAALVAFHGPARRVEWQRAVNLFNSSGDCRIAMAYLRSVLLVSVLYGAACGLAAGAQAPAYPTKPIRVVAPFAPGGGSDVMARLVAQKLTEAFMQQAIVENRAGAGGRVGTEFVARAAPDGYTLLLTGSGSMILAPALYEKLPYDVQKDFAPVSLVASSAYVLVTHPAVPVRSLKQLIALARSKPAVLNYASSGLGAPGHLSAELFQRAANVRMTHVAYKGTSPGIMSVVAGETDLMFSNILPAVPGVQSGRLRALAVTSSGRSTVLPDVPSVAESGLAGFETVTHYGVLAPGATPAAIVVQLNAALVKGLQGGDTRQRLEAEGSELRTSTPEQFAALIRSETEKWSKLVKSAGIKPE
ncbi:MAG: tripartite tricarboxylate transporter substrate-binding protein [Burkholderiales bacterium]